MESIVDICRTLNFQPQTLIEFGACHPKHVRLMPFIESGRKVILVEANPRLAYCLSEGYNEDDFKISWPNVPLPPYAHNGLATYPNVTIQNVAIASTSGKINLFEAESSSFLEGTLSPAVVNDQYKEQTGVRYEVDAVTIDAIDDGTIDVLLADIEGSEWFCLDGLISRPKIIILELYGWEYLNPYYDEIKNWMSVNGYDFTDRDHTDALFIRR